MLMLDAFGASGGTTLSDEPLSMKEALNRPDAESWINAAKTEVEVLLKRGTFEFVYPPSNAHIISSKFVFRIKRLPNGMIDKYKARLVARGFTQVEGVDYYVNDTEAPVARNVTVRLLLAYAASKGWPIRQMDVKSAYLYGKLDDGEVIHMRPPPDYQVEGLKEGQVLRLRRALYGLKQAGRRWYQVLVAILDKAGMKVSNYDRGLFIRHNRDGTFTALTSHVDDLTITSPSDDQINNLMETIGRYVEWTGGDSATWLLGIQISRDFDRCEIKLRQLHYIETILTRYGFQDIKTAPSPMDPNLKLSEDQGPKNPEEEEEMAKRPYAAAVGALRYLADMTRPDLAYAVGQLARYLLNPGFTHWTALKRVFH